MAMVVEEGEIVEEGGLMGRVEAMWVHDLSRPWKWRVVRSALEQVLLHDVLVDGLWLDLGASLARSTALMAANKVARRRGDTVFRFEEETGSGLPVPEGARVVVPAAGAAAATGLSLQDNLTEFLGSNPAAANFKGDARPIAIALFAHARKTHFRTLQILRPRVVPGTVLVFEKFINCPKEDIAAAAASTGGSGSESEQGGYQGRSEWRALLDAVCNFGWKIEFVAQGAVLGEQGSASESGFRSQQLAARVVET